MTLLRLLRQARRLYPLLGVCDLLIAGLEELLNQNKEIDMTTEEFDRRVKYVMRTRKVGYTTATYWVRRYAKAKEERC